MKSLSQCAFPSARLPLEKGKIWRTGLGGLGGWGDWDGYDYMNTYKVEGQVTVDFPVGRLEVWKINATTTSPIGKNQAVFYFHRDLGFVGMYYFFYQGDEVSFELEEVVVE